MDASLRRVRPAAVAYTHLDVYKRQTIALDCIDRGINVIIEKPMAMNMADAEEIIARSRETGRCV